MTNLSRQEYLTKLTKLVNQINREMLSSAETKSMLEEAKNWRCPNWDERLLLDDLIEKAKEYIELDAKLNSLDLHEYEYALDEGKARRSFLRSYFTDIQKGLRDNKSILCDLSS